MYEEEFKLIRKKFQGKCFICPNNYSFIRIKKICPCVDYYGIVVDVVEQGIFREDLKYFVMDDWFNHLVRVTKSWFMGHVKKSRKETKIK